MENVAVPRIALGRSELYARTAEFSRLRGGSHEKKDFPKEIHGRS